MKRISSIALAVALSFSMQSPSFAIQTEAPTVRASVWTNRRVYLEGSDDVIFLAEQEKQTGRAKALTYDNTTYVPLMTVGLWMGADESWDERSNRVTLTANGKEPCYYGLSFLQDNGLDPDYLWGKDQLTTDSNEGVEALILSDVGLTVNGREEGTETCLLFRDECYLPIDRVAQLLGKQYLCFDDDFHLYDVSAQKELVEARNYLSEFQDHLTAVRTLVSGPAPQTEEEYLNLLRQIQAHLKTVWQMPVPSFAPLTPYLEDARISLLLVLNDRVDIYLPEEESSGTAQAFSEWLGQPWTRAPRLFQTTFEEDWELFTGSMLTTEYNTTTAFMNLESQCSAAQGFMEAVTAALPDDAFAVDPAAYTDADRIVYAKAVTVLSQLGVISGKEDGSFDPQGLVTRAECAKMLSAMLHGGDPEQVPQQSGEAVFSDAKGHWAETYISDCAQRGILNGREKDVFDPDANVTGLELAKMALGALGYDSVAYQLTGRNWDSQTNRLALMVCDPSLYEELGEEVAVSEPITREVAAQILYNTLFNGVIEAKPDTAISTGEVTIKYTPMRDKEGQDIPFYSVYIDAAKWDVLSAQ